MNEISNPEEIIEVDKRVETTSYLRNGRRNNNISTDPSSLSQSHNDVDVVQIWRQLPEAIRLDPSLAAFQTEYEKLHGGDKSICSINTPSGERLVLNVSFDRPIEKEKQNVCLDDEDDEVEIKGGKERPFFRYIKLILLVLCWLIFTISLTTNKEVLEEMHKVSIPINEIQNYKILKRPISDRITVNIESSLLPQINANASINLTSNYLIVWIEKINYFNDVSNNFSYENIKHIQNLSESWILPLFPSELIDYLPDRRRHNTFVLENLTNESFGDVVAVCMKTNLPINLPISIGYNLSPINKDDGFVYAAVILIGLYILIIFEVVHKTIAAMMASTMSLAVLAALDQRPSMKEVISWIDMDTLMLLFAMMILVAVIGETGIFDYLSVYAYKVTGGQIWPLVSILCLFTVVISTVLDNVTTILLMTPVTIRLCEVMEVNPVPILTAMVIYSNIGGGLTPIGDPPNIIIASNKEIQNAGIDFISFVMHMSIGVVFAVIAVYAELRYVFRDVSNFKFDEPLEVQEIRHEIAIWQKAAASLSSYSKDENMVRETLMKKVRRLLSRLKLKLLTGSIKFENYKATLEELQEKYPIRDKWLLAKSGCALTFVIVMFFIHSLPNVNLSLGWISLLGAILLLILADSENLDGLMARVEWSTLLFFAALFILMEALSQLGLMIWIGKQTEAIILSVDQESRLAIAIILILWISAIVSAFVDNVPLCTMMVRIVINLSQNHQLGLPLQPLVWALAFGSCLGGNGTLIGSTANVVCAGVAEQHGYKFSFLQFFKYRFNLRH
ncbi:P protein isoform X2 [Leptopilina boulardi]|uniref:P protein isoform X2 n=1 Tax=Leptopilina boulardi TaxID=63433 RepID=UPI0021F60A8A|nr:P protein isoform X2 [Leptopilina boulardi]